MQLLLHDLVLEQDLLLRRRLAFLHILLLYIIQQRLQLRRSGRRGGRPQPGRRACHCLPRCARAFARACARPCTCDRARTCARVRTLARACARARSRARA
jgi:hypothetical protein